MDYPQVSTVQTNIAHEENSTCTECSPLSPWSTLRHSPLRDSVYIQGSKLSLMAYLNYLVSYDHPSYFSYIDTNVPRYNSMYSNQFSV
jgi:hypothetical protein